MDSKGLMTAGLVAGAGYFLYKALGSTASAAVQYAQPPAAGSSSPAYQRQPEPAPSGTSITTPTVTAPSGGPVAITPDSLNAAAVASGNPTMLNPDQWDWIVENVMRGQRFDIDASFGPAGQSGRTSTYSAKDFYEIATGRRPLPATISVSPQPVTTQTCPPYCGSDSVALAQALQAMASAAGYTDLRPDEWNWFAEGAYDVDRLFCPVGSPNRDGAYSAYQFAGIVMADVPDSTGGLSGLGWFTTDKPIPHNPILRPNIPNTGRWLAPDLRFGRAVAVNTKGGWAV